MQASVAATYAEFDRASRALGATPHGLISLLYDELLLALGVAHRAARRGDRTLFEARRERATLLLAALDHGLDHRRNPSLAAALSKSYRGLSAQLTRAGFVDAEEAIIGVAAAVTELADAWNQIAKAA
jgi:flagellar secretion chaperone FliS